MRNKKVSKTTKRTIEAKRKYEEELRHYVMLTQWYEYKWREGGIKGKKFLEPKTKKPSRAYQEWKEFITQAKPEYYPPEPYTKEKTDDFILYISPFDSIQLDIDDPDLVCKILKYRLCYEKNEDKKFETLLFLAKYFPVNNSRYRKYLDCPAGRRWIRVVCNNVGIKIIDWEELREFTRWRAGNKCEVCRITFEEQIEKYGKDFEVHHINPLCDCGNSHPNNLRLLCDKCHRERRGYCPKL